MNTQEQEKQKKITNNKSNKDRIYKIDGTEGCKVALKSPSTS